MKRVGASIILFSLLVACEGTGDVNTNIPSTVSGTVVVKETGAPAEGVEVSLRRGDGFLAKPTHLVQVKISGANGGFWFGYDREAYDKYAVQAHETVVNIPSGDVSGIVLEIPESALP